MTRDPQLVLSRRLLGLGWFAKDAPTFGVERPDLQLMPEMLGACSQRVVAMRRGHFGRGSCPRGGVTMIMLQT